MIIDHVDIIRDSTVMDLVVRSQTEADAILDWCQHATTGYYSFDVNTYSIGPDRHFIRLVLSNDADTMMFKLRFSDSGN